MKDPMFMTREELQEEVEKGRQRNALLEHKLARLCDNISANLQAGGMSTFDEIKAVIYGFFTGEMKGGAK